ncbi:MAG: AAA family ATPase [Luteolibacter sp.]
MILERIVLENFRQFKGRQEIVFSDLRERNVTLVHAENGFGKTTLLNALLWALYGQEGFTEDFEKPESLMHEGLAAHSKDATHISARVQVSFKHDGGRYILTRELTLAEQRSDPKRAKLSLEVMRDGQTIPLDNPQRRIQTIVPDAISAFLFFNGERIDHLAMEKNSSQVTLAIHQMLGLRLLRTTIEDLQHQNVRGKFIKELRDNTSDEKRSLLIKMEQAESKIKDLEDSKNQIRANLKAIDSEMTTIDNRLNANRAAHELQAKRIRLQDELSDLINRRDDVVRRLSKLVAEDGYTLFTVDLVKRGSEIMRDLRDRNMIPAPVIDTFLKDLLESGVCICDRHLPPGSSEYEAVQKQLSRAPNQDFNNAVSAIDHSIGVLSGVAQQTRDQLGQLNGERLELNTEIRNREEDINEIHQALGGKDDEEVQSLEAKRKAHLLEKDAQNAKLGALDRDLGGCKEDLVRLTEQIKQIEDQIEVAARAQRRVDAVEECSRVLQAILDAETAELRPILNDEIDGHFRKIIDREYWAELSPDYKLRIRKRIPGSESGEEVTEIDVALSTGQRQVTSLVFIASLLALARKRSEIPTILKGLSGNEYPLVTDSPFGSLSIFRFGVAKWVPDLAPQVVLLVSPRQFDGDVADALRETGRIGKRYYLAYHGPSIPDRAQPQLVVDGQTVQQYFQSEEEFTEIKEFES